MRFSSLQVIEYEKVSHFNASRSGFDVKAVTLSFSEISNKWISVSK